MRYILEQKPSEPPFYYIQVAKMHLGVCMICFVFFQNLSPSINLNVFEENLESEDDYQYFDFGPAVQQKAKSAKKPPVKTKPDKKPEDAQKGKSTPIKPREFIIHWYNPPPYLTYRPEALKCGFQSCKFKNCKMIFEQKSGVKIDAVIFDGRKVPENVTISRQRDQIWIFAAHEPPLSYMEEGGWWTKDQWRHSFNWTMAYDKTVADIFLPYGDILKKEKPKERNFKAITMSKSKGAIMISSNCKTPSFREDYMKILRKYIDIVSLGECGIPWNCGKRYVHDDCFKILNRTYRYYLAFENSFCRQYFTEKFYDNFNYDIIQIVRGGEKDDGKNLLPSGTFINTDDFKSIEQLGDFLRKLSWSVDDYSNFLKEKNKYYSLGFKAVYQRAMCDLCERMNNVDKFKKQVPDLVKLFYNKDPCRDPSDIH